MTGDEFYFTNHTAFLSLFSISLFRFFPTVLQPIVKILVNLLYIVGLRSGCRNAKKQQEPLLPTTSSTSSRASLDQQLSDMDYVDVERRRQIALKALNERLSSQKTRHQSSSKAKTSTSPIPGPSSSSSSSTSASILPSHKSSLTQTKTPTTTITMNSSGGQGQGLGPTTAQ